MKLMHSLLRGCNAYIVRKLPTHLNLLALITRMLCILLLELLLTSEKL